MSSAVKIPPQGGQWLGFDLEQVMAAVGSHEDLIWTMAGAWIVCRDGTPDKWQRLADQSNEADGVPLTWTDMAGLAEDCLQVIDGRFTGRRGEEPLLLLAAIDSSYWIVWAADVNVLDRVRRAFSGVEEYDEPPPP